MVIKRNEPCYVLGVGMTKFIKPRGKVDYTELGFEAGMIKVSHATATVTRPVDRESSTNSA